MIAWNAPPYFRKSKVDLCLGMQNPVENNIAYFFFFNSEKAYWDDDCYRFYGYSIRPVAP